MFFLLKSKVKTYSRWQDSIDREQSSAIIWGSGSQVCRGRTTDPQHFYNGDSFPWWREFSKYAVHHSQWWVTSHGSLALHRGLWGGEWGRANTLSDIFICAEFGLQSVHLRLLTTWKSPKWKIHKTQNKYLSTECHWTGHRVNNQWDWWSHSQSLVRLTSTVQTEESLKWFSRVGKCVTA